MTKYLEVIFIICPVGKTCTHSQLCEGSETKEPSKASPFFITMFASVVEMSSSGNLLVSTSHFCNLKVFFQSFSLEDVTQGTDTFISIINTFGATKICYELNP